MRRATLATAIICVFATSLAVAQSDEHRQLAEKLTKVMKIEENAKVVIEQMKAMQRKQLSEMGVSAEVSEEQKKRFDVISEELDWEKMRGDYVDIYVELFTEDELKGIISFYESPPGRVFVAKQPELMQKSMEIGEKRSKAVMSRLLKLKGEELDEKAGTLE